MYDLIPHRLALTGVEKYAVLFHYFYVTTVSRDSPVVLLHGLTQLIDENLFEVHLVTKVVFLPIHVFHSITFLDVVPL